MRPVHHCCCTTTSHSAVLTASNAFRPLLNSPKHQIRPSADSRYGLVRLAAATLLLAVGVGERKTISTAWLALVEARYMSALDHKSRRPSPIAICHRVPATHLPQRQCRGDRRRHSTFSTSQERRQRARLSIRFAWLGTCASRQCSAKMPE